MNNFTLFSFLSLASFICLFLAWLVIKTLKEGKEALKEMGRETK